MGPFNFAHPVVVFDSGVCVPDSVEWDFSVKSIEVEDTMERDKI